MLIVVVVVVVVVAVGGLVAYNGLVRRRNRTQEAWAQIDVELERRHDLVPNLVQVVEGYAAHERETLQAVTEARSRAVAAGAGDDRAQVAEAEDGLSASLRSLFAVAEGYPQLRASEGFVRLQEELTATEDKLEFARRYYNTSVRDLNTACEQLPTSLFATLLGFPRAEYFQVAEGAAAVPRVGLTRERPPDGAPG